MWLMTRTQPKASPGKAIALERSSPIGAPWLPQTKAPRRGLACRHSVTQGLGFALRPGLRKAPLTGLE